MFELSCSPRGKVNTPVYVWQWSAVLQYLSGPLPQVFIFIMGMVGKNSACAQLDASQQLHAACKHSVLRGFCAVVEQRDKEDRRTQHSRLERTFSVEFSGDRDRKRVYGVCARKSIDRFYFIFRLSRPSAYLLFAFLTMVGTRWWYFSNSAEKWGSRTTVNRSRLIQNHSAMAEGMRRLWYKKIGRHKDNLNTQTHPKASPS